MKRYLLIALLLAAALPALGQTAWDTRTRPLYITGTDGGRSLATAGSLLVQTGVRAGSYTGDGSQLTGVVSPTRAAIDTLWGTSDDTTRYPATGLAWAQASSLPKKRWAQALIVHHDTLWAIAGDTTASNQRTNQVLKSADGASWTAATAFPGAINHLRGVSWNDTMWTVGGWDASGYLRKVYKSATGASWSEAGSDAFPVATRDNYVVVHHDSLYNVGGYNADSCSYRSGNGTTWTKLPNLPDRLVDAAAVSWKDTLWVIAGYSNTSSLNTRKVYKSGDDGVTWAEAGSDALPATDSGGDAVVYQGRLYYVYSIRRIVYTDDGETWTQISTTAYPGAQFQNGRLASFDGRMFAVGAYDISAVYAVENQVTVGTLSRGIYPVTHKGYSLGNTGRAWKKVVADSLISVADIPFLDDRDDLALLRQVKGSGVPDPRTGIEPVDDWTLPREIMVTAARKAPGVEWVPRRVEQDGRMVTVYDSVAQEIGDRYLVVGPDGKPYYVASAMDGWLMGVGRALDSAVTDLSTYVYGLGAAVAALGAALAAVKRQVNALEARIAKLEGVAPSPPNPDEKET